MTIGPETTPDRSRRGPHRASARRRRTTSTAWCAASSRRPGSLMFEHDHLPHRLRAPGRLRRRLPRRDQADRARTSRSSTSRTASRRRRSPRARSSSRARSRTCPSAFTSRSSIRASAAIAVRSRSGRRTGASTSGPTTACSRSRRPPSRGRGGARADEPALPPRAGLADLPRPRHLRARSPRISRAASRFDELGDEVDPATLVRIELPRPGVGPAGMRATVLAVDRFGNLELNVARARRRGGRALVRATASSCSSPCTRTTRSSPRRSPTPSAAS